MLALIQYRSASGLRGVAAIRDAAPAVTLPGVQTTCELAGRACRAGSSIAGHVDDGANGVLPDLNVVELSDGVVIWEKPFLYGEANMSHSIRNLEHHHFKYANFRHPGDVHVHFFGTGTLSYALPFTLPVRNAIGRALRADVTIGAL